MAKASERARFRPVGAKLDRNGLRPLRYTLTTDGLLIVGSEVGIANLQGKEIAERQRLVKRFTKPGCAATIAITSSQALRSREPRGTAVRAAPSSP